jgi:hypothetical protein
MYRDEEPKGGVDAILIAVMSDAKCIIKEFASNE